jgi:kanamycin kinase
VTGPARLSGRPAADTPVPTLVRSCTGRAPLEAVWRNELGGLTYRDGERYLKWSPAGGPDLELERDRLAWAARFHPVPEVLDLVDDGMAQLLITRALPGGSAVEAEPRVAARALGEGLRALHADLPVAGCPFSWSAEDRGGVAPPPIDELVVAHGDPCVPNTLVDADGRWTGHVDLGRLGLADRWADLAVASMNLGDNFGPGWEGEFFAAYGIARDEDRIRYYRALWDADGGVAGPRIDGVRA